MFLVGLHPSSGPVYCIWCGFLHLIKYLMWIFVFDQVFDVDFCIWSSIWCGFLYLIKHLMWIFVFDQWNSMFLVGLYPSFDPMWESEWESQRVREWESQRVWDQRVWVRVREWEWERVRERVRDYLSIYLSIKIWCGFLYLIKYLMWTFVFYQLFDQLFDQLNYLMRCTCKQLNWPVLV